MKPLTDTTEILRLLTKTNDFIIVLALRYKLSDNLLVSKKKLKFYKTKEDVILNLALLSEFYGENQMSGQTIDSILKLLVQVGQIREYLIYSLENPDKISFLNDNEISESFKNINIAYKTFLEEIRLYNILEDFLNKKEVLSKVKSYTDKVKVYEAK